MTIEICRTGDLCGSPHTIVGVHTMPRGSRLMTASEVGTVFRVDPKTVGRWAKAGKISFVRTPGGHRRYDSTEVMALLARHETSTQ